MVQPQLTSTLVASETSRPPSDLSDFYARTIADREFTYRGLQVVAVYINKKMKHTELLPCAVIEFDVMLAYLNAGGTAAWWMHPNWGATAKYGLEKRDHSLAISRWVANCQLRERAAFRDFKLDLTRPNLVATPDSKVKSTYPARELLSRSKAYRGLAQGRNLGERLVRPEMIVDLERPFEAWL